SVWLTLCLLGPSPKGNSTGPCHIPPFPLQVKSELVELFLLLSPTSGFYQGRRQHFKQYSLRGNRLRNNPQCEDDGGPGRPASYTMLEDELALFEKSMNGFGDKFGNSLSDNPTQVLGLRDAFKDSVRALSEKLSLKLKEEERLVGTFLEYPNQLCKQNKRIQEKKDNPLKMIDAVKDKEQELEVLRASIQDLKGEYSRKKESDQLQVIFTSIDPKNPESPYMFSLSLNEARDYEVSNRSSHLECLAEFQEKVRETNKLSAFLANVRKAFIATVYN
ncbi:hypothetical protein STEG23_011957, partial [Scotinomys teguina]